MADDTPTLEDIEQLRASLLMMIGGMELLFHGAMQAVEVGNRLVEIIDSGTQPPADQLG
jgi:hypothetical protein